MLHSRQAAAVRAVWGGEGERKMKIIPMSLRPLILALCLFSSPLFASAVEVFAKGSISKNYLARDKWTISVSATTGLAVTLIPHLRIEARYTNISALQNTLDIATDQVTVTLNDIKTQTAIYSVGVDIDFFSEKSPFQPFLFLGGGYLETDRSYYYRVASGNAVFAREPKQLGITANVGLGFRLRLARTLAFEIEAFGYGTDIHKANPLLNLYGTAGVRLFL